MLQIEKIKCSWVTAENLFSWPGRCSNWVQRTSVTLSENDWRNFTENYGVQSDYRSYKGKQPFLQEPEFLFIYRHTAFTIMVINKNGHNTHSNEGTMSLIKPRASVNNAVKTGLYHHRGVCACACVCAHAFVCVGMTKQPTPPCIMSSYKWSGTALFKKLRRVTG